MQKFIAEESFWELFPDAAISVLVVQDMMPEEQISSENKKTAAALLAAANIEADKHLVSNTISQNPVVAVWRDAYGKFAKKKGARCSMENLLKRVLKGNPVGSITPSVDISNGISLSHAFPMGTEDTDKLVGDFRLAVTQGGDDFLPIGEEEPDPTLPGELCYLDDAGAVCRCWNWRDGQRTEVTDASRNQIFIMECIEPDRIDELRTANDELAQQLADCLGATIVTKDIITHDHPEAVIKA